METDKNISTRKTLTIYTIMFIGICFISFAWFLIRKNTFIWYDSDGFLQHIPWLKKLHDMIFSFIKGNGFAFWSFDIGLGADQIGNLYSILFDPFSYLAALFPVQYLSLGYTIGCILRFYVAGISMLVFLKYHNFDDLHQIIGAISYAFSHWIIGSFQQAYFLNVAILFPLIILGIDMVLDGERPHLFIVSVSIAITQSIYFTYMSAVLAILYYVVRYWLGDKDSDVSLLDYLKKTALFFLYVCLACCLAAFSLIPSLYVLLNSMMSSGVESSFFPTFRSLAFWGLSLTTPNTIFGHYSYTGTNSLLLATVPLMIDELKNRNKRVPIIMFFFCLLAVEIPAWDMLMNGLSYPVGRWCYALAFFFVWGGIIELNKLTTLSTRGYKRVLFWTGILILPVLFMCSVNHTLSPYRMMVALLNIGFIFVFVNSYEKGDCFLLIALSINIAMSYCLTYSPHAVNKIQAFEPFKASVENYETSVLRVSDSIDDTQLYRVDFLEHVKKGGTKGTNIDMPSNEAMYWGENTLTAYISTLDYKLGEFNKSIANGGAGKRRTSFISYDNRTRLNYLLGVKYFLYEDGTDNEDVIKRVVGYNYKDYIVQDSVGVMKAVFEPSLGYVFDETISEAEFSRYSALAKEQILMEKAVVPDEKLLSSEQETKERVDIFKIPYTISDESSIEINAHSFSVLDEEAGLILNMTIDKPIEQVEVYVKFSGLKSDDKNDIDYYVSDGKLSKRVYYRPSNAQAVEDVDVFLTNLGYFEDFKDEISIDFASKGEYTFDNLEVFAVPISGFVNTATKLEDQRLVVSENKNDFIKGIINSPCDGILFLSLVYNPGWEVYIDGEKQDTFITDICFTGVRVPAGKHEVVLKYQPVGFNVSIILFLLGCAYLIGLEMQFRNKQKKAA